MARSLRIGQGAGLRLTALLAAIAAAAASLHFAWVGIFGPLPVRADVVRTEPKPAVMGLLQAGDPPPFEPAALVERPLFSPTRAEPEPLAAPVVVEARPAPVVVAPIEQVPDPAYVVGGVVISPAFRKVLLRAEGWAKGRWLREGEATPDGWTVSTIAAEKVILSRGKRKLSFPLRHRLGESQKMAGR